MIPFLDAVLTEAFPKGNPANTSCEKQGSKAKSNVCYSEFDLDSEKIGFTSSWPIESFFESLDSSSSSHFLAIGLNNAKAIMYHDF